MPRGPKPSTRGPKPSCPDFLALRDRVSPQTLTLQLVECFAKDLRRWSRFECLDRVIAEDVSQDTIRLVLENFPQFRGEASVETWLKKLVRSACHRHRRGRKNHPAYNQPLEALGPAQEPESQRPGQESQTLLKEWMAQLTRSLSSIEPLNRELFLLHEGEEVPLLELSARFGLSVDGIKGRLKRTREKLRALLLAAGAQGKAPDR